MASAFPLDLKPHWRLPTDYGYGPATPPDEYILGDIWISRERAGTDLESIEITEASPKILVGDELLRDIKFEGARYHLFAEVELTDPDYPQHIKTECPACRDIEHAYVNDSLRASHCFTGYLLRINAKNRQLVYRIGHTRRGSVGKDHTMDINQIVELLTGVDSIDAAVTKLANASQPTTVRIEIYPDHIAEAHTGTASGRDYWVVWHKETGDKRIAEMKAVG